MTRKHQKRVVMNLLVIAALALFLWIQGGCPLPTLEMELHRAERQRLADRSQVIWTYKGLAFNDRDMLVGVTGDSVHAYSEVYGLDIWARSVAEPTLVLLPERTRYAVQGGSYIDPALLAVDPPAGAETAQLTLDLSAMADGEDPCVLTAEAARGEDGLFFFQLWAGGDEEEEVLFSLVMQADWTERNWAWYPYTLSFFDGSGALIAAYDSPAAGGAADPAL